jgi:hypothetical protein
MAVKVAPLIVSCSGTPAFVLSTWMVATYRLFAL